MTTFDNREKQVENKFAHDEEMAFKLHAKVIKLVGLWAAQKLGKQGEDAQQYATNIVLREFESAEEDVTSILLKEFSGADLALTAKDIRIEIERVTPIAREKVLGGA